MAEMQVLGEFYFSRLLGTPIYDAAGKKIGKIRDMAIRWQSSYPRIVGIKYRKRMIGTGSLAGGLLQLVWLVVDIMIYAPFVIASNNIKDSYDEK